MKDTYLKDNVNRKVAALVSDTNNTNQIKTINYEINNKRVTRNSLSQAELFDNYYFTKEERLKLIGNERYKFISKIFKYNNNNQIK